MNDIWQELYNEALKVQNHKVVSPFIEVGGVSSTILTKAGNIYTGVCIDTACGLGMCAERNAIANMITNGESEIDKLLCIMSDGNLGYPCGACRELLMQLDKNSGKIEILTDLEARECILLESLVPNWWGKDKFED